MAGNRTDQYLEGKVLTASQPRLHLMLLEAAVRKCRSAQQAGASGFWGEFDAALDKAMDILEELVMSVAGKKSELSEKLEEQYAFYFRELTTARFSTDLEKLSACEKLLDYERETWKQLCDKTETPSAAPTRVVSPHFHSNTAVPSEGLSFEA